LLSVLELLFKRDNFIDLIPSTCNGNESVVEQKAIKPRGILFPFFGGVGGSVSYKSTTKQASDSQRGTPLVQVRALPGVARCPPSLGQWISGVL